MSHVSARQGRTPSGQPPAIHFFNPTLVTEREAGTLWRQALAAIDRAHQSNTTVTKFRVKHKPAELGVMYCQRGRLRLFTVRLIGTNELVLKGNRDGLLPLDGETCHGR